MNEANRMPDSVQGQEHGSKAGTVLDIKKGRNKKPLAARDGDEQDGLNPTRQRVKSYPSKPFTKVYDLGAHAMVSDPGINKYTRVLMLLVRDSAYGGRVHTTAVMIANELHDDAANIRKHLKKLEGKQHILRVEQDTGGSVILLNPGWYAVGNAKTEQIAKAIWSREQTKRMKQQHNKAAPSRP